MRDRKPVYRETENDGKEECMYAYDTDYEPDDCRVEVCRYSLLLTVCILILPKVDVIN